ncbi:MAG: class I SAM-dependent methyltransferase [Bacteroidia bacterium]|nr:class I SAM-dependent methyltransferase [Bacteroidia bacterium]
MNSREFLSNSFPTLARLYKKYKLYLLSKKSTGEVFTDIYKKNTWKSIESHSGPGSTLLSTKNIRQQLPLLINELKIKTFLDLPCGDYNWMKEVKWDIEKYIGADIVPELINGNNKKYKNDKILFATLNLLEDKLPDADIIFCRDCLVHLSFDDIAKAFANIKNSNIKYILTTTFPNIDTNENIITGRWRRLDFRKEPFNLQPPFLVIEENNRTDMDRKCMGLWEVKSLNYNVH